MGKKKKKKINPNPNPKKKVKAEEEKNVFSEEEPIKKQLIVECQEPDIYDIFKDLYRLFATVDLYKKEMDRFVKAVHDLQIKVEPLLKNEQINTNSSKSLSVESIKNIVQLITICFSITIGIINFIGWIFEKLGKESPLKGLMNSLVDVLEFLLEVSRVFVSV